MFNILHEQIMNKYILWLCDVFNFMNSCVSVYVSVCFSCIYYIFIVLYIVIPYWMKVESTVLQ